MKRKRLSSHCRERNIVILFVLFIPSLIFSGQAVKITLLATSDMHGHIHNWDYFKNQESPQGLSVVSTLVKQERVVDPDLLLFDAGDVIQGSPLVYYHNTYRPDLPNPMALVMNQLRYDAMTIGNHEYNFGQSVLGLFIENANFPVMSANIKHMDGEEAYIPYILKLIKGIRIGIIGLTTLGIPVWERPEHIQNLRFDDPIKTAQSYISEMQIQGVQIIVALVHSGPHKVPGNRFEPDAWQSDPDTWVQVGLSQIPNENFILKLAEEVPEIDVIISGHTHLIIPAVEIQNTLIVQPYALGRGISKVQLLVDLNGNIIRKQAVYMSTAEVKPDESVLSLSQPYHNRTMDYVQSPIGTASDSFQGSLSARFYDGPLVDFINTVQLKMAREEDIKADISVSALFNTNARFQEGILTRLDVYRLYQYDNTLYAIKINGDILKRALEHNTNYWKKVNPDSLCNYTMYDVVNSSVRGYQWDMYTGIRYQIDLTKSPGERIVDLIYQDKPVSGEQTFVLLLNNYRAGGGGGFHMFKEGQFLWESNRTIRDYMIEYINTQKVIHPSDYFEKNWSILPHKLFK